MDCQALMTRIAAAYRDILQENLLGIYVHGSIAFGCFQPQRSDVDFIVVVGCEPPLTEKCALIRTLLELEDTAPPKGVEMSVVQAGVCRPFVYPTPYVLHYSRMHRQRCLADVEAYCAAMHGTDVDLAAHFTVIRAVGLTVYGRPIAEIFGEVPKAAYLDSIRADVANAAEDVLREPVYVLLNLCRVLAYQEEEKVLSKAQGGQWGVQKLPAVYAPLLRQALACYTTGEDAVFAPEATQRFCAYMRNRIFEEIR